MAGFARTERGALCDLLVEVGPDAPTLCAGWTTTDLAAHLVTRDRVAKAGPGLIVARLHGITERAERATRDAHGFADLVRMVREGVPGWHPARFAVVDENTNLVEFVVHHEDVRRAQPDWKPRDVGADEATALWSRLGTLGRLAFRKAPVGVLAERPDGSGRRRLHRGEPAVTLVGDPVDLLLYAFGRRGSANVELRGDPAVRTAFEAAPVGL